jgi:hypothetical protein
VPGSNGLMVRRSAARGIHPQEKGCSTLLASWSCAD